MGGLMGAPIGARDNGIIGAREGPICAFDRECVVGREWVFAPSGNDFISVPLRGFRGVRSDRPQERLVPGAHRVLHPTCCPLARRKRGEISFEAGKRESSHHESCVGRNGVGGIRIQSFRRRCGNGRSGDGRR